MLRNLVFFFCFGYSLSSRESWGVSHFFWVKKWHSEDFFILLIFRHFFRENLNKFFGKTEKYLAGKAKKLNHFFGPKNREFGIFHSKIFQSFGGIFNRLFETKFSPKIFRHIFLFKKFWKYDEDLNFWEKTLI